jgi:hypothetical protein
MKVLAYQTTDEVHRATTDGLTANCGAQMVPLFLNDPPPNGQFNAVLYDLDYLYTEARQAVLAELLAGPPHCPTGVHSFNLDEEQEKGLRRNGVVVSRRLDAALIRRLVGRSRRTTMDATRSVSKSAQTKQ